MIPMTPILIFIFSLLSASVIGIDASVSMFVFLIVTYKPICFVIDFVLSRVGLKNSYDPKSRRLDTKEFIREIDESGDHHE